MGFCDFQFRKFKIEVQFKMQKVALNAYAYIGKDRFRTIATAADSICRKNYL